MQPTHWLKDVASEAPWIFAFRLLPGLIISVAVYGLGAAGVAGIPSSVSDVNVNEHLKSVLDEWRSPVPMHGLAYCVPSRFAAMCTAVVPWWMLAQLRTAARSQANPCRRAPCAAVRHVNVFGAGMFWGCAGMLHWWIVLSDPRQAAMPIPKGAMRHARLYGRYVRVIALTYLLAATGDLAIYVLLTPLIVSDALPGILDRANSKLQEAVNILEEAAQQQQAKARRLQRRWPSAAACSESPHGQGRVQTGMIRLLGQQCWPPMCGDIR